MAAQYNDIENNSSEAFEKSLIYSINNKGPKTEP